jgi:glycosyltransferase involved in cell wall biosynthesis
MTRGAAAGRDSMRIAMVSRRVHPAHGPGGMERKVYDLACRLASRGVAVDLFTETPRDVSRATAASAAMPDGVILHWVPGRWLPIGDRKGTVVIDRITNYPLWTRRVARWLRGAQYEPADAVHAHGLAGSGFADVDVGAPLVLSVEGLEEFQVPAGLKRWAYAPFRRRMRRAAAAASIVVATDAALQPVVERHLGIAVSDQALIPNAVDPAACRMLVDAARGEQLRRQMGVADAAPLFVSLGRLVPNKGFDVMIEALGNVAPRLPDDWAWVLIGDGPQRTALQAAARRARIDGHVVLAGALPDGDLHSLVAAADWFVHPTLYEGSSIATLEAMAHGLPVVATRAGGLPDKVRDGQTGFLVAPGDAEALGSALLRTTGADGPMLGGAGRRLCEAEFGWDVVVDRYLDLYRGVAGP